MIRLSQRPLNNAWLLEDTEGTLKREIQDEVILIDMARAAAEQKNLDVIYVRAGDYLLGFKRDSFGLNLDAADGTIELADIDEVIAAADAQAAPPLPVAPFNEALPEASAGIRILPGQWYEGVTIAEYQDNSMEARGFQAGQPAYIKVNEFSLGTRVPSWQVMANNWAWHINVKKATPLLRADKISDKQDALDRKWKQLFSWGARS